jgi:hypothetical protein
MCLCLSRCTTCTYYIRRLLGVGSGSFGGMDCGTVLGDLYYMRLSLVFGYIECTIQLE